MSEEFRFTEDWFSLRIPFWDAVLGVIKPRKILEIGSYEGRSTTYILDKVTKENSVDIVCVDTWEGGEEHKGSDFSVIESNFDHNMQIAQQLSEHDIGIHKMKGTSLKMLSHLILAGHENSFDLIYVDGSHQASDVFFDGSMAYHLARTGGIIVFDDNVHNEEKEWDFPGISIYGFYRAHIDKVKALNFDVNGVSKNSMELYQVFFQKVR